MCKGKVWLVGAGPGDPNLITIKGKDVLDRAQVVIHDALVGHGILAMIPSGAKCINVGKRAGNHLIPQNEINRIICDEVLQGQRVVRLKGGDPYLFGRGGEEAEYLRNKGIAFEIVPGITSPIAVSAYNGIPVTHRKFASSVHFITAHKREGEKLDIDFKSLTALKGTYIFMMGVSALHDIMVGLLAAGMSPDMPAAILSRGTTRDQKRIVASISTLEEKVKQKGVLTPAIIVVGHVCSLSDSLSWIEDLPLFGRKIFVTRPKGRSSKLTSRLRSLGADVVEIPTIKIIPTENKEFDTALSYIEKYSWIVFTSPTGVEIFFNKFKSMNLDVRKFYNTKFAVIGAGTSKALFRQGIIADFIPEIYDTEYLARGLVGKLSNTDRVMIPRARLGSQVLTETLAQSGAELLDLPIYDTVLESHDWLDLDEMIKNRDIDFVTFTSASTVHNFVKLATKTKDFSSVMGVCIGRQTNEAAQGYGFKTIVSESATIESMCECISDYVQDRKAEANGTYLSTQAT